MVPNLGDAPRWRGVVVFKFTAHNSAGGAVPAISPPSCPKKPQPCDVRLPLLGDSARSDGESAEECRFLRALMCKSVGPGPRSKGDR